MLTSSPPKASLYTIGCRLNQSETALFTAQLKQQGYEIVEFGEKTDLLLLNTCSVTEDAEKDCRYIVRKTLRHSPDAFVAVTGCYAQTGKDTLVGLPGVDMVLGTEYKMKVVDYLPKPSALQKQTAPEVLYTKRIEREDFTIPGVADYSTTRANLKIQDGCNFMCSFCIIPFARGHERSRKLDDVLREASALAAAGHREIILTGVNIGQYRQGQNSLLELLQQLEAIQAIDRIRISSIEPTTIPDSILELMASSRKLCSYLHVPLQSGDDSILNGMNRRYTVKEYADWIGKAVSMVPNLGLGTDVMVGFPGEGEKEYANTYALCSDLPFSYLHVFSYSERPGTASLRHRGKVPPSTIHERSRNLAKLSEFKRTTFNQKYIGTSMNVLFEDSKKPGIQSGLTDNYIRTTVVTDQRLTNKIRTIQMNGIMKDCVIGQLLPDLKTLPAALSPISMIQI